MNNFVADELANKVFVLHKALNQAEHIISVLEEENKTLRNALDNLAFLNNEDYSSIHGSYGECEYAL